MSVEIITGLKEMKLNSMASCYPALVAKSGHSKFEPDTFIKQLIGAETAERTVRAMAYQMGAARLLMHRDLADCDFTASQVDEALIRELHQGKFIAAAQNLVLIGGPGTGKTHLATIIGNESWRFSHSSMRQDQRRKSNTNAKRVKQQRQPTYSHRHRSSMPR